MLVFSWTPGLFLYASLALVFSLAYLLLIYYCVTLWNGLSFWRPPDGWQPYTKVSVLIPARNEADNITRCLDSILGQGFPAGLLEIIVIDDHSTDGTPQIVKQHQSDQVKLLQLSDHLAPDAGHAFKKNALTAGVRMATGSLILTTDADCIVPENWLRLVVSLYESRQPAFIAAPVNFYREKNLLQRFQSLDFLGMMLITGAGIHSGKLLLANGANMAYPRQLFRTIGGYEGLDHLASGDDVLLLRKIARRYPERIFFLKNAGASVRTEARADLRSFFRQRLRWATKNTVSGDWRMTAVVTLVFLLCWSIILSLLAAPFFGWPLFALFLIQLFIKAIADFRLLHQASNFFGRPDLMRYFWPGQLLHILYIAIIGLAGTLMKRYEWKGRKVR